jgi:hypothetical protein
MRASTRHVAWLGAAAVAALACANAPDAKPPRTDSVSVDSMPHPRALTQWDSVVNAADDSIPPEPPDSIVIPPRVLVEVALDSNTTVTTSPGPAFHAPDQIPFLPSQVRDTLIARGCRVSQRVGDFGANIARGTLYGQSQLGIAIWCELGGKSRMFVFQDGRAAPDELRLAVATLPPEDMKPDGNGLYCVGGISIIKAKFIMQLVRLGKLADVHPDSVLTREERSAPLHDGIIDGDCDGASNIHYWTGQRWVILPGGD